MNPKLREKTLESLSAVLPITAIILLIGILMVPLELGALVMFVVGALMLILGMGFFQLGAEMSMTPIGEGVGVELSKAKTVVSVVLIGFVMGVIITVSEPDLQVLAEQDKKVDIMRRISETCGMHSEAKGVVLSLPIDEVMGL